MRKGHRTVMTMSNNYKGPPENFAMVVPVPVVLHKEDVKTLPADVFDHIDSLSAPRLVEYWEQDPCRRRHPRRRRWRRAVGHDGGGRRSREARGEPRREGRGALHRRRVRDRHPLGAATRAASRPGCTQNKYTIPDGAKAALAPYMREQMKFFVAKVNIQKVQHDATAWWCCRRCASASTPTSCGCRCASGLLNADGKQDLIVYVLHPREALRGGQLSQRLHPDQPRSHGRGAQELRRASTPSSSTPRWRTPMARRW